VVALLVVGGEMGPRDFGASTWTFSARCVVTARSARRLRDEFDLDDAHAVAILLRFLQRIEALERELAALRG
jgi:chaperone modulatory protein CbpM